jgi:uncharacterized membrane protein YdfJ with MMPL/SSD domain
MNRRKGKACRVSWRSRPQLAPRPCARSAAPTVKQFGVGLSVGVALAATTVLLLAPALLVLAGTGTWWVPRWADRFLPHLDIEGDQMEGSAPARARAAHSMQL